MDPTIAPSPPKLPSNPVTTANLLSARFIPISPRTISPHDNLPITDNDSPINFKDLDTINIDAAPRIAPNPPKLPSNPVTTANSASAPPIADKPLRISPQDIDPKFFKAS